MVQNVNFILFSMALAFFAHQSVAAGGRGSSTPTPVIVSASIAPNTDQITIRGHAFGAVAPVVLLGDQQLVVKQSGEKEIVATLPGNMPPAAYSLLVVRNKTMQSPPFTLLVMAN